MKIVATKTSLKQIGPDDWMVNRESKIFDIDSTIKDVLFWANTDSISEIEFSRFKE